MASKVKEQPNADALTCKRFEVTGYKWEEHSVACFCVGCQEMGTTKLTTWWPLKVTFHAAILSKVPRGKGKKLFQQDVGNRETAGQLYLGKWQKGYALECNFLFQHFNDWNGLFLFYLTVHFYKEIWATFGFISYDYERLQDTCWVSEA